MTLAESLPIADAAARRQALDPSGCYVVTAPAGSGKTELLTQRVLRLLALCDYPEEILAITFTRKAAQEMRQRILQALHRAQNGETAADAHTALTLELAQAVLAQDQRQQWQLLLTPNRLRIQTIDSFSQLLVRQLPFTAGPTGLLNPTEQPQPLYRQAVRQFLQLFNSPGDLQQDLGRLLQHLDNRMNDLQDLLVEVLENRGQWLNYLLSAERGTSGHQLMEASVAVVIRDTLARSKQVLRPWLERLVPLGHFAAHNLLEAGNQSAITQLTHLTADPATDSQHLPLWQGLAELLTTGSGSIRKPSGLKVGVGFPPKNKKSPIYEERKTQLGELLVELTEVPAVLAALQDIKTLPAQHISTDQWQLLDSLARLLPRLVAEFQLLCVQHNQCDFAELSLTALRALGEDDQPSDLALKLDYQIKHILVDEFQDTSLPQLQLLEKLTSGWQPDDGRTLFVVGDAMQSCYGFRDANVSLFLDVRDRGVGDIHLTHLPLTVNFRSDGGLVNWVNRTFKQALPQQDDLNRGAVSYQKADAFHPAEQENPVQMIGIDGGDGAAEAAQVLTIIQQHLAADSERNIAILVRSRPQLVYILDQLRRAQLPWQARDVDRLDSRMAVVDLLSLTRALLDFSDRVAWLALLRAPWCGLDMHDLHCLANQPIAENPALDGRYPLIWGQIQHCEQLPLSDAGQQALQRLRQVLAPSLAQAYRKPLRQWVEGTWLALGGPASIANPTEQQSPLGFFELLEQHTQGGSITDWETFEQALAKLYDRNDAPSRIQVMTLHKAKGLEFDAVILPNLDSIGPPEQKSLMLWQSLLDSQGNNHVLLSPLGSKKTQREDSFYTYLRREKKHRQHFEIGRLLYIGCTRAKHRLYLLARLKRDKYGELSNPSDKSLLYPLWDSFQRDMDLLATDPTETAEQPQLSQLLRLPPHWQVQPIPVDQTLAPYRPAASFGDNQPPSAEALRHRHQRQLGILLHQYLQQIREQGLPHWDTQRVATQHPLWVQQLQQWGMDPTAARAGADKLQQALTGMLADATGQWLLDSERTPGTAEMSLLDPSRGFRESRIDLTFIADGERWIVDFKSSEPGPDQDEQAFVQTEIANYQQQLTQYGQLLKQWDPHHPLRAALYFPLLTRLVTIDIPQTAKI